MRVAVDEARDRAEAAAVDLDDVAVERRQVAHAPDRLDRLAAAEDVRVLEHVDLAERGPAQRRVAPGRRRELREVADEQRARVGSRVARRRRDLEPPRSAASIASG